MAPDRSLRIGIDARELLGRPTGVGRYLLEVLQIWSQDAAEDDKFILFAPGPAPEALPGLGARVEWRVLPGSAGTWWEQSKIPRGAAKAACDVFLGPGYSLPVRISCPSVVLLHDVSFFAHPEWFSRREGLRRRLLARAAARRAAAIGTLTEFSAGEIVRWLHVPRERILLAPPGAPEPDEPGMRRREPIVLFVGSLFTRRRIPELLRGFAIAARELPDARLILVGENRTHPRVDFEAMTRELGLTDRVEWRAYAADAELADLYRHARVFAFLSDYEGFAMTPLEAIAHGAPAILLDTPVAREVYEGGAAFVPPDAEVIGRTLVKYLSDDDARAALRSGGQTVLKRYSWRATADRLHDALRRAARA